MKKPHKPLLILIIALLLLLWLPGAASAVVVDPLPEDNLIANPWFHAPGNLREKSSEGWVDETGNWSYSRKVSNPGLVEEGTAARLADTLSEEEKGQVIHHGGEIGRIYTVVAADPADRSLRFKTHFVSLNIVQAEANIYGGPSADGPWERVWTPFLLTPENETRFFWQETEVLHTHLVSGHPFYKIEFVASYEAGFNWGFKFTGVYFSAQEGRADTGGTGIPVGRLTPGGRRPFNGYVGIWE